MPLRTTLFFFLISFSYLTIQGCGSNGGRVEITTPNITISNDSGGIQGTVKLSGGNTKIVVNTSTTANPATP